MNGAKTNLASLRPPILPTLYHYELGPVFISIVIIITIIIIIINIGVTPPLE